MRRPDDDVMMGTFLLTGGLHKEDRTMPKWLLLFVVAGVVACPSAGEGRLLDNWPYDKLMKESDLVVFTRAVKTTDTRDEPPKHSWPNEFVGQDTTFSVAHTVKGKLTGDAVTVLHFKFGALKKGIRPGTADELILDGPMLVSFRTKGATVTIDGRKQYMPAPEYLLFLKARKDGRYEPVSGPIDPQLSVREVFPAKDMIP